MIPKFFSRQHAHPWLILPAAHEAAAGFESRIKDAKAIDAFFSFTPPKSKALSYTTQQFPQGTIAEVNLEGPIIHKADDWDKYFGAIDPAELGQVIWNAAQDNKVDAILLNVDSPGGTAAGTPEVAELVNDVDRHHKPVVAYIDGMAASAAYWIASQARHVCATISSQAGCIGVYMAFLDQAGAYEQFGYFREIIKNTDGTHKAAGYPGTSLTAEQREAFQDQMDEIHQRFLQAVNAARGDISEDAYNGFTYTAAESQKRNLVDRICNADAARRLALSEARNT